jgi:hypothetical protein
MSQFFDHFSSAYGIALLAGCISLLGLVISKEQKISEFRQDWINELRKDIANVISNANATFNLVHVQHPQKIDKAELWRQGGDKVVAMTSAIAMIRLRLNPKEAPSRLILESISQFEEYFSQPFNKSDFEILRKIEEALLLRSSEVLKEEWIRVRKGERFYRFTLYVLSFLFVLGVAAIVVCGLRSFVHQLR